MNARHLTLTLSSDWSQVIFAVLTQTRLSFDQQGFGHCTDCRFWALTYPVVAGFCKKLMVQGHCLGLHQERASTGGRDVSKWDFFFFLNEWYVGFRQMAEGFTEKASLWDCGLAWGSLEKSVNPRSSRSLTGLTGLPATYEQEAGASVLEITSLFFIKACWQDRGREKLFSSPILFSYIKTILEFFFLYL